MTDEENLIVCTRNEVKYAKKQHIEQSDTMLMLSDVWRIYFHQCKYFKALELCRKLIDAQKQSLTDQDDKVSYTDENG